MAVAPDKRRSWLARQLATLAVSQVQSLNAMAPLRAASWHNHLARLGLPLPLFVVHDLGVLLTAPPGSAVIGSNPAIESALRMSQDGKNLLARYQALLQAVAESEVVQKAPAWRLRDELVAVLLGRILGDLWSRFGDPAKGVGAAPLPLDPTVYQEAGPQEIAQHWAAVDPQPIVAFVRFLVENRLQIFTSVERPR